MHYFGYCSQSDAFKTGCDEAWLLEQQTLFNFAKYKEVDPSILNKFQSHNKAALSDVIQLQAEGRLASKVYGLNLDKEQQIRGPDLPMNLHCVTIKKSK